MNEVNKRRGATESSYLRMRIDTVGKPLPITKPEMINKVVVGLLSLTENCTTKDFMDGVIMCRKMQNVAYLAECLRDVVNDKQELYFERKS